MSSLQINLSELAKKYGITGTTANMVVKEFLVNSGIDMQKFSNTSSNLRIRRGYEKMPGK